MASEWADEQEAERMKMAKIGSYGALVRLLVAVVDGDGEADSASSAAAEETMLLWGLQQPTLCKANAFVCQSSHLLRLHACGYSLSIIQSPSSFSAPGVTGAVMWDSGVILAKFLEHAVNLKRLVLQGKKVVELGSGCGLVGCIAALLGSQVALTDLPDRLRLLKKNVESNLIGGDIRGSAAVHELTWGDDLHPAIVDPLPDYVLGADLIYSEEAVTDLLVTLLQLCGDKATVFLASELRNDTVLEYFLDAAMKDFTIGRVPQAQWHPEYHSQRAVLYTLVKKVRSEEDGGIWRYEQHVLDG